MSVKNITTIKPVRIKKDKLGRPIQIFRGGIRSTNKYDNKSPKEIEREKNMGNKKYDPNDKRTHRK